MSTFPTPGSPGRTATGDKRKDHVEHELQRSHSTIAHLRNASVAPAHFLGTSILATTSAGERAGMPTDIVTELECRSLNGESPRWDAKHGRLIWVDTRAPTLNAFDPVSKHNVAWEMPSWIGCAVLSDRGALCALRTGLYSFEERKASLHQIGLTPYDIRRFIFNDGGCDPAGRFLVGEMYLPLSPGDEKERMPDKAPLFRYSPNGTWVDMAASVKTSNGLAWSPDGLTMYQSDTAANTIYAFDYEVLPSSLGLCVAIPYIKHTVV